MVAEPAIVLEVVEASQPGEVRRAAVQLASRMGFDETEQGAVAIVATELANNLVRHAKRGEMLLQGSRHPQGEILEILSLDHGPGIVDVEQALRDGFSTGGTSGTGLGAVRRLSAEFDLHAGPGMGTTVLARLARKAHRGRSAGRFQAGAVSSCYPGETVCGDAWGIVEQDDMLKVLVVDGLGHGQPAADAAQLALRIFREHAQNSPADILELAGGALRSTRGAAVAVAEIAPGRRELRYAGIGNIAGMIVADGQSKSLVSSNGIVGAGSRKAQSFSYPWSPRATLLMFSDGLNSHLRADRQPGLLQRDPTTIAAALYREFKRGRDDATVLVVREQEESAR